MSHWNWFLDGWIVVAGILCAASAALLGSLLVLRRMSLLADGISHAVLPGLALAFLVSGSRASWLMFVGAMALGLLTAAGTQWIRRVGNVDEGASLGIVFTVLFAMGLVMIDRAAGQVDLDPGCVLFGSIELTPLDTVDLLGARVPQAVLILASALLLNVAFVVCFFKELQISVFDPGLARALGIPAGRIHYALMVLVSITAVASFESVGSILVVAMFIGPPAAAWLLTNRLSHMMVVGVALASLAAVGGHLAAIGIPRWFGIASVSTAGMMSVMTGVWLALAVAWGPKWRSRKGPDAPAK